MNHKKYIQHNHRNKRKASVRRCLTIGMSVIMTTSLSLPAFAAPQKPNTEKEEVVYINLDGSGSPKEVNVVNIFELDEDGQIVDYGNYNSLRNMTTTDTIHQEGDAVTIDAKAGKLYYEGKPTETEIPWDIAIHYYLDGKEYNPEEIAGMSGSLRICVSITQNEACRGTFFDDYALQASLTLNCEKCRNIIATDATVANVGKDKQLTYTILPGKGADFTITADVTEFETDGFSINAILLNMNVEVDDSELMEQVNDLLDAIRKLDDGADELNDGASELQDRTQTDLISGVKDLQSGASELQNGVGSLQNGGGSLQKGAAELKKGASSLDTGVQNLNQGIKKMQTALNRLNQQSATLTSGSASFKAALAQLQSSLNGVSVTAEELTTLRNASSAIKTGIDNLVNGITTLQQSVSFAAYQAAMQQNGLDIDALQKSNTDAITELTVMLDELNGQISVLQEEGRDTTALTRQVQQLQNVIRLLAVNNASIGGTQTYLNTINQNLTVLLQGATDLQTNYTAFDSTIGNLVDTLTNLTYQMTQLSLGVNTLVSEYEKLDQGITDYTGGVAAIVAGYKQISSGSKKLVTGSDTLKSGTADLYDATGQLLSGIARIYEGTGTLKDGTGELDDGVAEFLTGIVRLNDGTKDLKDGTSRMRDETNNMDDKIDEKIDDMLESITGGDVKVNSFISNRNTNVKSVQFVIQTESIQIQEPEIETDENPKKTGFWEKIFSLFH